MSKFNMKKAVSSENEEEPIEHNLSRKLLKDSEQKEEIKEGY